MSFGPPTVTALTASTLTAGTLVPASLSSARNEFALSALEGWLNTRQTFSNAAVTILATTRVLAQTGTMSAARIATLPAANALPAGTAITVQDESGTVTTTNTISVARAGSDTINGVTTSVPISGKYGACIFITDGTSNWDALRLLPEKCNITSDGTNVFVFINGTQAIQWTNINASFSNVVTANAFVVGSNINIGSTTDELWTGPTGAFAFRATSGGGTTDLQIKRNAAGQAKITSDGTVLAGLKLGATTTVPGLQINAAASGTQPMLQFATNGGSSLGSINYNGGIVPTSMADASAANGTLYYSTDASKLVYKDAGGVVNNLY